MPRLGSIPRLVRGILFSGLCLPAMAYASPYRPADDAQVLQTVPADGAGRVRRVRSADAETSAAQAQAYIERARSEGDPRLLGYAQGVLQPWWNMSTPPASILLLRATLQQSSHHFEAALGDLDQLLRQQPDNAQAWLIRATVLRVQGRYPEAAQSCRKLLKSGDYFLTTLCISMIDGLSGHLEQAVLQLRALQPASRTQVTAIRAWYATEYAEALERLGQAAAADTVYRDALRDVRGQPTLKAAYADFLLDQDRPEEALNLVIDDTRMDALKLRAVLAQQILGRTDPQLRAALADTYAASHRRNEDLHLREEAWFTLRIEGDAMRALELAQLNWSTQREPSDTRLLLEAALAAGRPEAAQPVREWMQKTGYEDRRPLRQPVVAR